MHFRDRLTVMVITGANRVGVPLVAAAVFLLVLPSTGFACVEHVVDLPDGPSRAVDLEGDLVYVAFGDAGINVYDVSACEPAPVRRSAVRVTP